MNLRKKVTNQIVKWNNKFPLDFWWRSKYNIPYGSKGHREMSFIDMLFDFQEEKMMKELNQDTDSKREEEIEKSTEEEFDNLDISKY